jgi:hypothetical protein
MNHNAKKIRAAIDSFQPTEWKSARPKPKLSDFWDNPHEAEDMAKYIDWHGRHPHCVSPRNTDMQNVNENLIGVSVFRDEDAPGMIYSLSSLSAAPIPERFSTNRLGVYCNTSAVSLAAMNNEREQRLDYLEERPDAWFTQSVKDFLEQHHIDGDHTTVKWKRAEKLHTGVGDDHPFVKLTKYGYVEHKGMYICI